MRKHLHRPGVWIVALLLCALWLLWPRPASSPLHPPQPTPAARDAQPSGGGARPDPAARQAPVHADALALPGFLPPQARATIVLVLQGGPFPHAQDGAVFGNHEGRLPSRRRGFYREYTVDTPGLGHRGTRRIVTGGDPPVAWYYTDDHYDSFRQFQVATGAGP